MSSYKIHGDVHKGFEKVRDQFVKNFNDGLDKNSQLCVYVGDERVIDIWGSVDDFSGYDVNSIAHVFSSTKTLTAVCMATLVNKKLLDYSDKVVKHWPEYGNGDKEKEEMTVADILRHEGGMARFSKTLRLVDILRENIKQKNSNGSVIEEQTLHYPPAATETKREYHGLTRGCILNEIFRRVDPKHRTIGECLRDDICSPLNADCYIGLEFEQLPRSVELSALSVSQVFRKSLVPKFLGRKSELGVFGFMKLLTMYDGSSSIQQVENMTEIDFCADAKNSIVKTGELPSCNGQCSARGFAKIASMMANKGKSNGKEILSEETWNSFHDGKDSKVMHPFEDKLHFSQGGVCYFTVDDKLTESMKSSCANREGFYGWVGMGGSVFQWHPEYKIGFGYVPTFLAWEDDMNNKTGLLQKLVVECVKEMQQE